MPIVVGGCTTAPLALPRYVVTTEDKVHPGTQIARFGSPYTAREAHEVCNALNIGTQCSNDFVWSAAREVLSLCVALSEDVQCVRRCPEETISPDELHRALVEEEYQACGEYRMSLVFRLTAVDGLTREQCFAIFVDNQRSDTPRPLTSNQLALAREEWSAQLRTRTETAKADAERKGRERVVCDDDRWDP